MKLHKRFCLDDTPQFSYIALNSTTSTNDFLKGYRPPQRKEVTLVSAEEQTAGRGQQGNSWEAEKGKNLLFSLRIHPHTIEAAQQFILSQALALSLKRTLDDYTSDISIKWPNDIYWKDKKIAGILIENELTGKQITSSVLGVGLNINQTVFHSDAPNPVSLAQIIGHEEERQFILESIIGNFTSLLAIIEKGETEAIRQEYQQALYRRENYHTYRDKEGHFEAALHHIEPTGHLVLLDRDNRLRQYAFKEIEFVIG